MEIQVWIIRRIQGLRTTVIEDIEIHDLRDLLFQESQVTDHRLVHPVRHQNGAVFGLWAALCCHNHIVFWFRWQR